MGPHQLLEPDARRPLPLMLAALERICMTTFPTPQPPPDRAAAQSPPRALGARVFQVVLPVLPRLVRSLGRALPGWTPNP